MAEQFVKYNPSQPRDERGRWTDSGAESSAPNISDPKQRMFGAPGLGDMGDKQGIGVVASTGDSRTPEQKHADAWENRETYEPDPKAAAVAANYRASQGLPEPSYGGEPLTDIPASLDRARAVASIAMLNNGEITLETRVAYNDLARQTAMQLDAIRRAGVKVEFLTKADIIERGLDPEGLNPYPTARAQRDDVANGRLMIASLIDYPESHHPLLDSSLGGTYDQFRAVHDYFGHAAVGTGFDRHGEFQAWLNHTSMFTGPGRQAASSELHVENSFLASRGTSAPHFATLLPEAMVDPFTADGTYKGLGWLTGKGDE